MRFPNAGAFSLTAKRSCRAAIVKVRETRLKELSRKGDRNAATAERVISRLDLHLSACQIGITLASLGLGWVGEPAFAHLFEPLFGSLPFLREALESRKTTSPTLLLPIVTGLAEIAHVLDNAGDQRAGGRRSGPAC